MAKRFLLVVYLCLQTFLLCGYVSRPVAVRPVVDRVDVYEVQDGIPSHLCLTDPVQMEKVLGCLRAVDTHIPAENQYPVGDHSCTIRVGLTNGKFHTYRQVSDAYFCKDSGQWKAIDPKQGARLFSVISTLKTQCFQGAFLFYDNDFLLSRSFKKIFDKTTKNTPLSFVRNAVIYLIVKGAIAI